MASIKDKLLKLQRDIFAIRDCLKDVDANIEDDLEVLEGGQTLEDLATKDYVQAILCLDQIKDRNCQFNFGEAEYNWKLADLIKRNGFKHVGNYAFMFCENPYVTQVPPIATVIENENGIDVEKTYGFPIDLSKAYNVAEMFRGCPNLTQGNFLNIDNAYRANGMFKDCINLDWDSNASSRINLNYVIKNNETKVGKDFGHMFDGCSNLKNFPVCGSGSPKDASYKYMFRNCSSLTHVPQDFNPISQEGFDGVDYQGMFLGCESLKVGAVNWDTSSGFIFSKMFSGCKYLTNTNCGNIHPELGNRGSMTLNCKNGTDFEQMFNGCGTLVDIDLTSTQKAKNMKQMFYGCYDVVSIKGLEDSQPTNCEKMFGLCQVNLESLSIGDMSQCDNCNNMFYVNSNIGTAPRSKLKHLTIANSKNGVPEWKCKPGGKSSAIDFSQCYFSSKEPLESIAEACLNYIFLTSNYLGNIYIKLPTILFKELALDEGFPLATRFHKSLEAYLSVYPLKA